MNLSFVVLLPTTCYGIPENHDKARQNRHNLEKILERPDMQVAALN